jgi:hypothetical protein
MVGDTYHSEYAKPQHRVKSRVMFNLDDSKVHVKNEGW